MRQNLMPPSLASLARQCTLGTVQCLASLPARCHSHQSLMPPSHASQQSRCGSCQTLRRLPTLASLLARCRSHRSLMLPSHAFPVRRCKLGTARCLASLAQQYGTIQPVVSLPEQYHSRQSLMLLSRASVKMISNPGDPQRSSCMVANYSFLRMPTR